MGRGRLLATLSPEGLNVCSMGDGGPVRSLAPFHDGESFYGKSGNRGYCYNVIWRDNPFFVFKVVLFYGKMALTA